MGDTSIEWCLRPGTRARTWNPTQGCALKSAGCTNCYAQRQAKRFAGPGGWAEGLVNLKTGKWAGVGKFAAHRLAEPLGWREPSTVFVNSMSDLFWESFTNEQIAAVFGVMAACPQHTFQILTKRPDRMLEWFAWVDIEAGRARDAAVVHYESTRDMQVRLCGTWLDAYNRGHIERVHGVGTSWPLRNVWLGTSTENQDTANERIPHLLNTPAAVRFISAEPLLGPITISDGEAGGGYARLDWVIAGAESGPGARPCDVAWLRSLRDQCEAADIPFFLKQAYELRGHDVPPEAQTGDTHPIAMGQGSHRKPRDLIGAPYLDGEQHLAFPQKG